MPHRPHNWEAGPPAERGVEWRHGLAQDRDESRSGCHQAPARSLYQSRIGSSSLKGATQWNAETQKIVRDDVTGTVREQSHVTRDPGVGPVTDSEEVVSTITPARRAMEVCYLVFGIIDALLIIRLVLKLLAANPLAGFSSFVYGITAIFMAPFRNLLPVVTGGSEGSSLLEMSVVHRDHRLRARSGWALARVIALMFARNVTVAHRSSRDTVRPRPN